MGFGHVRGTRRLAAERGAVGVRAQESGHYGLGLGRVGCHAALPRLAHEADDLACEPHGRAWRRVLRRVALHDGAHVAAEVRVADQFGEFPPAVHLLGRGVVGKVGGGAPHRGLDVGAGVEPFGDLVHELLDDAPPFVGRQPCRLVQQGHLLGVRLPLRHGAEHRAAQPQCPDLRVQRLQVDDGDGRDRGLQPRHGGGVVQPVVAAAAAGPAAARRCHTSDAWCAPACRYDGRAARW